MKRFGYRNLAYARQGRRGLGNFTLFHLLHPRILLAALDDLATTRSPLIGQSVPCFPHLNSASAARRSFYSAEPYQICLSRAPLSGKFTREQAVGQHPSKISLSSWEKFTATTVLEGGNSLKLYQPLSTTSRCQERSLSAISFLRRHLHA